MDVYLDIRPLCRLKYSILLSHHCSFVYYITENTDNEGGEDMKYV